MKKRIYIISVISVMLILIAFYSVDTKTIGSALCSKVTSLSSPLARLSIETCQSRITWLTMQNVTIVPRKLPIGFKISTINTALSLASLVKLAPTVSINADLYHGTLLGSISASAFNAPEATLQMNKLHISSHPALKALGVTSGTLSIPQSHSTLDEQTLLPRQGTITIALDDLAIEKSPFLYGIALEGGSLAGTLTLDNDILSTENLLVRSSYGTVILEGNLKNIWRSPLLNVTATIQLSIEGERAFGPLLRALAQLPADSTEPLRLTLQGPLSSLSIKAHSPVPR